MGAVSKRGVLVLLCVLMAAFALRLVLAWLLPPLLDVYYYDSQAVQALLHGQNPYGHLYAGVPGWLATPDASSVFAYLPAVVLFLLPFGAVWDVRLGLIVADLVVALSIASLGGKAGKNASLIFFLAPFDVLFSTSYPNNNLVAMCFLGLAAALEARGRRAISATALGVSLAGSQFVWLLYPFFVHHYLRQGWRREVLTSLAVAAAIMIPFLVWNPGAFVFDTVQFQFVRPVQHLLTPMPFGFNVDPTLDGIAFALFGVGVPLFLRAPVAAGALIAAVWKSKSLESVFFNATWFLLIAVWLLPNDFSPWYLELPFQTLLMWFALNRRRAPPNT